MTYRILVLAIAFSSLVLPACEKSSPAGGSAGESTTEREPVGAKKEPEQKKAPAQDRAQKPKAEADGVQPAPGWTVLEAEELSERQQEMLERAKRAQQTLGKTLMKELSAAVAEKDFAGGVEVCQKRAPAIAQDVSQDLDVRIGRTSHKLRNPQNTPPKWAEPFVEAKVAGPTVLAHKDRLGYMAPIKLGQLCVNCHGPADKLAPEVSQTLSKLYPKDEAIGFEPGELRGWFWVEVPES